MHVDLTDVLRVLARKRGKHALWVEYSSDNFYAKDCDWILITENHSFADRLRRMKIARPWFRKEPLEILWTDNYSNLVEIIHFD